MADQTLSTIPSRRLKDVKGKIVHNLLVAHDSGNSSPEFRVQCEVLLSFVDAHTVLKHLEDSQNESFTKQQRVSALEQARDLVVPKINPRATDAFRETVMKGFEDNIAYVRSSSALEAGSKGKFDD